MSTYPVGIWIRVSTMDQAKENSPQYHEQRCRDFAEKKGWDVVEIYRLLGVSGKDVMKHPESQRMIADVSSGRIKTLVFTKLERLARNTRQLIEFSELFHQYDAHLVSISEALDTSSPVGRLYYMVISALAQWERDTIAERISGSLSTRAASGKQLGGIAPFGYRWEDGHLMLEPKESPIRAQMYNLFLEYRKLKTVARVLNDQGYRTREGKHFTNTTIKRLLQDPIVIGQRRANYTRGLKDVNQWKYKTEDEWVSVDSPLLIEPDIWQACQKILTEIESTTKGRPPVVLCSGLVYCGTCGKKLYPTSVQKRFGCRRCKVAVEASVLEQFMYHFISDQPPVMGIIEDAQALAQDITQQETLLAGLREEQARLQREHDKLYALYQKDRINGAQFKAKNDPLAIQLAQITAQIPRLEDTLNSLQVRLQEAKTNPQEPENIADFWPHLTGDEKQILTESLITRITLMPQGQISVHARVARPIHHDV